MKYVIVFCLFALTAPVRVYALDDDLKNMDLGSFSDQQKPSRLKINLPNDAPLSPKEKVERNAAASRAEVKRTQLKPNAPSLAAQKQRKEAEARQRTAQKKIDDALAAKDYAKLPKLNEQKRAVDAELRSLK